MKSALLLDSVFIFFFLPLLLAFHKFLESRRPKIISFIPDYLLSVSVTNIENLLYISMNHSTLAPYWCLLVCPSFPCSTSLYLSAQMHARTKWCMHISFILYKMLCPVAKCTGLCPGDQVAMATMILRWRLIFVSPQYGIAACPLPGT